MYSKHDNMYSKRVSRVSVCVYVGLYTYNYSAGKASQDIIYII